MAKREKVAKTPEQRQQERRERFLKLAEKRVTRALIALRNVARMGNRASYSYTDTEASRITETLMDVVTEVRDAFSATKTEKPEFKL